MKQTVIHHILNHFSELTQLSLSFFPTKESNIDGTLRVSMDKRDEEFTLKFWKEVRKTQLVEIKKLKDKHSQLLIVTERFFPEVKEQLRLWGVAYIDSAGNGNIQTKKIFVFIDGFKQNNLVPTKKDIVFTPAGLQTLYSLLITEDLINQSQRSIAELTGASLGSVNSTIRTLHYLGYLIKTTRNRIYWNNKTELIQKWASWYHERYQPMVFVGTFRFAKKDTYSNWRSLLVENDSTFWGGEPAGAILTDYFEPEVFTLYTNETTKDLIKNYQLLPDPSGNVKVYTLFWKISPIQSQKTTHPLLVYADLLSTGNSRCIEVASLIFDCYLTESENHVNA
jgi:hypothetical protein